jgi:hypothetical protein
VGPEYERELIDSTHGLGAAVAKPR